ncbi:MAG: hypothetical protein IPK27_07240 [Rhodanobacteraceae bacterium]|nr:hypothetical protein [Rhodanobacteraceae bacterium]
MFKKAFFILLRVLCYASLAVVVWAFVTVQMLLGGDCPRIDTGAVICNTPAAQETANAALGVILVTFFTGVPGLFALGGAIFLVKDLWRLVRGRRESAAVG